MCALSMTSRPLPSPARAPASGTGSATGRWPRCRSSSTPGRSRRCSRHGRPTEPRRTMMDVNPPPRHRPRDLAGYLEALSRPVFQAGMSWRVIDAKWEGIREAFAGFDPVTVAEYGPADIVRLLGDRRVVRSKAKIEATVDNAQALLELDAEYGGFARYLRSR